MKNVICTNLCVSIAKSLFLVVALCLSSITMAQTTTEQATNTPSHPQTESSITSQVSNTDPPLSTNSTVIDASSEKEISLIQHDLSPWGMFQHADIIVKIVMIGLLLASIATWTIFIAKLFELLKAKKALRKELLELATAKNLKQAGEIASNFTARSLSKILIKDIQEEVDLSADTTSHEGIKERAAFRQDRLIAASGRNMNTGTGVLATIGAVSPFVGLFGTVWGIMNSFIGIAKSQTTNLAIVAPGIAEALLATAMGLVAAIPAVIIYNVFTRSIAHYKVMVSDISAQTLLLLSRDLDRKSQTTNLANTNRSNITKIG